MLDARCKVYSVQPVQCGYNQAAIYYQLRSDYANYLADPPVINYSLLCLNFTGAEVEQSLHPCTLTHTISIYLQLTRTTPTYLTGVTLV